jgi:anaerobic selenocysteine-containing dehydrogenase
MCISRCGVVATVEDGRLTKVNADPAHPNGCICVKGTAAPEIAYSPDRLRSPMKRGNPKETLTRLSILWMRIRVFFSTLPYCKSVYRYPKGFSF